MERIDAPPRLRPLALLTQYRLFQCASIMSPSIERVEKSVFPIDKFSESRTSTVEVGWRGDVARQVFFGCSLHVFFPVQNQAQ